VVDHPAVDSEGAQSLALRRRFVDVPEVVVGAVALLLFGQRREVEADVAVQRRPLR
jgi:hypothetical protein